MNSGSESLLPINVGRLVRGFAFVIALLQAPLIGRAHPSRRRR